jgi:hypothetical protein
VTHSQSSTGTPSLVGNRLVLIGAVVYLLEWVAIIAANVDAPLGAEQSTQHLLTAYDGRVQALGWASGWFGIVLLGRVLIVIGLRTALADSGRPHPLMDLAVAAMLASVVIETATYAIVAGAAWSHAHGGSTDVLRGIDAVGFQLDVLVLGPAGVSLVCSGYAMWVSRLFPRVLSGAALLAGTLLVVHGLAAAAPGRSGLADGLSLGVAVFWLWMLWLGVLLWRRVPTTVTEPAAPQRASR